MLHPSDEKNQSIVGRWQKRNWGEDFDRENEQFQWDFIGEGNGVIEVKCKKFGKSWDKDRRFSEQLQAVFLIDWMCI